MAYVIAEAGACHDGYMSVMRKMCYEAYEAGADAIKFQWTSDANAMAERRGKAKEHGYASIYQKYLQWPYAWHDELQKLTVELGMEYLCTVYLPEDVRLVAPYVERFKVSSFESLDYEFISAHAPNDSWTLLHCVSSYPAPLCDLNLRSIFSSWTTAAPLFGFSDHSEPQHTFTGALAVAAGAEIIEAHFKHEETDFHNPAAPHAMTVEQLTDYISMIRETELVVGGVEDSDCPKRVQDSEAGMMKFKVVPPPLPEPEPKMFMATTKDVVERTYK